MEYSARLNDAINVASFLFIKFRKLFIAKINIHNNNCGIDKNINYRLQAKMDFQNINKDIFKYITLKKMVHIQYIYIQIVPLLLNGKDGSVNTTGVNKFYYILQT
jgi:hypothetical protein